MLPLLRECATRYPAEIYPEAGKMKKQMEYANRRGIPMVVIVGSETSWRQVPPPSRRCTAENNRRVPFRNMRSTDPVRRNGYASIRDAPFAASMYRRTDRQARCLSCSPQRYGMSLKPGIDQTIFTMKRATILLLLDCRFGRCCPPGAQRDPRSAQYQKLKFEQFSAI